MLFTAYIVSALLGLTLASPIQAPDGLTKRETLNELLAEILSLVPGIDGDINDVAGDLTSVEELIATATDTQTTYNELGGPCTEYTVIFARGTTEPGNVGILVGPPLFDALDEQVGASAITIQGVNDYSASISGYLEGGDPVGSATMAAEISQAVASCPSTKLVVSGYSQGGQLVHNAISSLPAATAGAISSVVIFGDPDSTTPIPNVDSSKVLIICHTGDDICQDGDIVLPAHLTYGLNATAAATFIVETA